MKIRCIAKLPNEEQAKKLGKYYHPGKQDFYLEIGKEYIVFGLFIMGGELWVELESDPEMFGIFPAPLCLFEITDGRISRYWRAGFDIRGYFGITPPQFEEEYFVDDLWEGVPEVVERYRKLREVIIAEAESKDDSLAIFDEKPKE